MTAEGSSLETIKHMVATNLGITLLPFSAVTEDIKNSSQLAVRQFTRPAPRRTIALAWRASFPGTRVIDLFTDVISRMDGYIKQLQKEI